MSPLFLLLNVLIGFLQPGYDSCGQTVSELASVGQPFSLLIRGSYMISGITLILFSMAVKERIPSGYNMGWASLAIIGFLTIVGSVFPIDLENPGAASSIIHTASGILLLLFSVTAFSGLSKAVREKNTLSINHKVLLILGIVGLTGIIMVISISHYSGLGQRIFYLSFAVLVMYLAAAIIKLDTK